jgi:phage shock protein C
VAGGIADYFDVDPTLIRLAWVLLAFSGVGILAYVVAWIIMPEEPWRTRSAHQGESGGQGQAAPEVTPGPGVERDESGSRAGGGDRREYRYGIPSGAWILGLVLMGVGVFLLLRNFLPMLWFIPFWPLIIILVGVALLVGAFRSGHDDGRERKDRS